MVQLGFTMRNMVDEAAQALRARKETSSSWKYDREETKKIRAEINAGLEDVSRLSREIQAQSEVAASTLFLTF